MPKVTEIRADDRNKNLMRVFAGDQYLFSVTHASAQACGLKEGLELSDELLRNIRDSEADAAISKAVNFVCRSPKTKRQVGEYLAGKGFDGQAVEAAVRKMEQYRYIDDAGYAEAYISFYGRDKGRRRLFGELKLKGIGDEIISASEALLPCQTEAALKAAEKFMRNRETDRKNMEKLYRHLAAKGFEISVCGNTVKKIFSGAFDEL